MDVYSLNFSTDVVEGTITAYYTGSLTCVAPGEPVGMVELKARLYPKVMSLLLLLVGVDAAICASMGVNGLWSSLLGTAANLVVVSGSISAGLAAYLMICECYKSHLEAMGRLHASAIHVINMRRLRAACEPTVLGPRKYLQQEYGCSLATVPEVAETGQA